MAFLALKNTFQMTRPRAVKILFNSESQIKPAISYQTCFTEKFSR